MITQTNDKQDFMVLVRKKNHTNLTLIWLSCSVPVKQPAKMKHLSDIWSYIEESDYRRWTVLSLWGKHAEPDGVLPFLQKTLTFWNSCSVKDHQSVMQSVLSIFSQNVLRWLSAHRLGLVTLFDSKSNTWSSESYCVSICLSWKEMSPCDVAEFQCKKRDTCKN